MRPSIIAVEGFYADPEEVVKYARSLRYATARWTICRA
jgi:hypothetical protein